MELHIRGDSKTYSNGVQALKDVTLTIPAGIYGLLDHFALQKGVAERRARKEDVEALLRQTNL